MSQANGEKADSCLNIETIIIGAGFGGLRMLYELRKRGMSGRVFESGTGVGGVCFSYMLCVIHFNLATNLRIRLGIGTDIPELVPIVKAGSISLHT